MRWLRFEAAVEKLQLAYARASARVIVDPTVRQFPDLDEALKEAEIAAARLPLLMATLRSQTNEVIVQIERELPPVRALLQRMQDAVPAAQAQLTGDERA